MKRIEKVARDWYQKAKSFPAPDGVVAESLSVEAYGAGYRQALEDAARHVAGLIRVEKRIDGEDFVSWADEICALADQED